MCTSVIKYCKSGNCYVVKIMAAMKINLMKNLCTTTLTW